MFNTFNLSI